MPSTPAYQPFFTHGWQLMAIIAVGFLVVGLIFSYARRKAARDTQSDEGN